MTKETVVSDEEQLIKYRIAKLEETTAKHGEQIAMLLKVVWVTFGIVAALQFLPTLNKIFAILSAG